MGQLLGRRACGPCDSRGAGVLDRLRLHPLIGRQSRLRTMPLQEEDDENMCRICRCVEPRSDLFSPWYVLWCCMFSCPKTSAGTHACMATALSTGRGTAGNALKEGGGATPPKNNSGPDSTPKAFPYPNTGPNRISNRQ